MRYRLGVDIGGTFTDFTLVGDDGRVLLWKEDTTADDPVRAIDRGLGALAAQLGTDTAGLLDATALLVHGTTVATNMLIQRNGPLVGLLCTEGFRDVLYFRDGYKPDRFNLRMRHPGAFVDRWLRLGVRERVDRTGAVLEPLDEADVRAAARRFALAGVQAVAVSFLWSMLNARHEQRAREILREELPGAHVVCSHEILPEIREWERTSATVLSAYILPRIREYLTSLETRLAQGGLTRPPLIMQVNGGCARVNEIIRRPIGILASGPAAAPAAALHFADLVGQDLITVDMGGTSLDVCLIRDGHPAMNRFVQVEDQPIGIPAVEVHSVGAGGGSIAWIDAGDALRVGPRSAGARPGPAAYGLGGAEPTVTDANVVLGYLDPRTFLGGRRVLREDLAAEAVERHVAAPLGLSRTEAAAGIVRVVNANMVAAIRAVSVERGIDPRGFTLVCGGGAGGLHCAELARELGIAKVFVPLEAGVLCSLGMTVTDIRHDHVAPFHASSDGADLARIDAILRELEERARRQLAEEGVPAAEIGVRRSVDARYPGQHREITIALPGPEALDAAAMRALEQEFHLEHQRQYAYARPGLPIELLHWRVAATARQSGRHEVAEARSYREAPPARLRPAYSEAAGGMVDTAFHDVAGLALGAVVRGPAVICAPTTTIVLHDGDELRRAAADGYVLGVAPKRAPRLAAGAPAAVRSA